MQFSNHLLTLVKHNRQYILKPVQTKPTSGSIVGPKMLYEAGRTF